MNLPECIFNKIGICILEIAVTLGISYGISFILCKITLRILFTINGKKFTLVGQCQHKFLGPILKRIRSAVIKGVCYRIQHGYNYEIASKACVTAHPQGKMVHSYANYGNIPSIG